MNFFAGLSSLLFPERCLICDLQSPETPICSQCLPGLAPQKISGEIDGVRFYSQHHYGVEMAQLILQAKEGNSSAARKILAGYLARTLVDQALPALGHQSSRVWLVLIPAPSTRAAERVRGYRHCELLAQALQKVIARSEYEFLGVLDTKTIARGFVAVRAVRDQTLLNSEQRAMNLSGAYSLSKAGRSSLSHHPELGAAHREPGNNQQADRVPLVLILLDDVMTSGSTMREGIRSLRSAGFEPTLALLACVSPRLIS